MGVSRRVLAPARDGLRMYWKTALLLALVAGAALAALIPVTALSGPGTGAFAPRLGLETVQGGRLGLRWSAIVRSPGGTEQRAVQEMFRFLSITALAMLVTATLTILNLSAARAVARTTELAVRRAVGASRRGLLASLSMEGLVVAALAIAFGGAIGAGGFRLARATWPGTIGAGTPGLTLAAVAAVAIAVILGGILPVVFARRSRLVDVEPSQVPLFVPALQLVISLAVLAAGSLLADHAASLSPQVGDLRRNGTVLELSSADSSAAGRARAYGALLDRLARDPRYKVVSLASPGTLVGLGTVASVTTDCGWCVDGGIATPLKLIVATHEMVSADTFRALDVHLLEGRWITNADRWDARRVAVVNRALAARNFQGGQAMGRSMMVGTDNREWYTVVGVVDDPKPIGFGSGLQPPYTVYLSILQQPAVPAELLLRSTGSQPPPAGIAPPGPMSATLPYPEADLIQHELAPVRWFGRWLSIEGWVALAIGAIGIFALMRLWVASLLPELGVRRALGARRHQLLRFILSRAAVVGIAGIIGGLWFGPALWGAIATVIGGLPAWNSAILVRFATLLVAVTMAGALLPAWKASRSTPVSLLDAG
jgi:hypothetical protein